MKTKLKLKKNLFVVLLNVIVTLVFYIFLLRLNVLSTKYIAILTIILILINLLLGFLLLKKKKVLNIIGYILSILFIIIYILGLYYVNKTSSFLNDSFGNKVNTYKMNYYVISKVENNFSNVNDIDSIGYFKDLPNIDMAVEKLKSTYNKELSAFDDLASNVSSLKEDKIKGMLIESNMYDFISESFTGYDKDLYTKVYEFDIEIEEDVSTSANAKADSFNIYIGGADFTNLYTDLNMIVTINKDTHKILLTSTPRDYYVKVSGKGAYDLLGYAGVWGIKTSVNTIADIYDINIDYYVKINTNSLVGLVDTLGGLQFCSDKDFTTTHAQVTGTYDDSKGQKLNVKKGCHTYNGVQILTIARERKAFPDGDRQRQKNCQEIMISIFKKMTNASNLTKYSEVLDKVSDLYTTNLPSEVVTDIIKETINGANWTFDQQSVTGTDSRGYVHLGSVEDYVMRPNVDSINNAKLKIKEVYGN